MDQEATSPSPGGSIASELLAAQNLERAVRLRVKGAHWDEIAQSCGYSSPAAALRAVGEAMAEATQRAAETADQMRDTANLRLDYLLGETLDLLHQEAPMRYDEDGNPLEADDRTVKLRAIDEARRIIESGAKLNRLLDKPKDEVADIPTIRVVGVDPSSLM